MLLSRKEVFYPTQEQSVILGHMGYAAFKLWNVGNYEKRNYKELGFQKFPNWYDQKKRLKENFFYKNLPSQTAQDVLGQLQEAWKSFFVLQKTKGIENPRPPRFKNDKMDLTFLKDAIRQTGDTVRLTIPRQLKEYLRTQNVDANYIYLKIKRFSNICIKELQIKFAGKKMIAVAVYEKGIPEALPENGHYLSIDLGLHNTFTCYDSEGKSFLLRGFMDATHYCDKKIGYFQQISDRQAVAKGENYPKKTNRELALYQKKRNKVMDFVHKATRYVTEYCREQGIHRVIIGDIKGIRKNKDMGRVNQQLHALPFAIIYQKLEYKLAMNGITLIRQKESYSSQCSPDTAGVSAAYAQKSNRITRGLYADGKQVYNADSVGAYNILRLYLQKEGKSIPGHRGLSSPVQVSV